MENATYQIKTRIPISLVNAFALLNDLAHPAPALIDGPFVARRKQLVGPDGRDRSRDRVERQDLEDLGGLFLGKALPDLLDVLLRRQFDLLFLLVVWSAARLQRGFPLELQSAGLHLSPPLILRLGFVAPAPWCKHGGWLVQNDKGSLWRPQKLHK